MCEFLDHTADLRLKLRGATFEELFEQSLHALMIVLAPRRAAKGAEVHREVNVEAGDRTFLLVDFLNQVLWLAQTHRESYWRLHLKELSENRLIGELEGMPVESFEEDVKAVTYHDAEIEWTADGKWQCILVLDV